MFLLELISLFLWNSSGLQGFYGETKNWQNVHCWGGGVPVCIPGFRWGESLQIHVKHVLEIKSTPTDIIRLFIIDLPVCLIVCLLLTMIEMIERFIEMVVW